VSVFVLAHLDLQHILLGPNNFFVFLLVRFRLAFIICLCDFQLFMSVALVAKSLYVKSRLRLAATYFGANAHKFLVLDTMRKCNKPCKYKSFQLNNAEKDVSHFCRGLVNPNCKLFRQGMRKTNPLQSKC